MTLESHEIEFKINTGYLLSILHKITNTVFDLDKFGLIRRLVLIVQVCQRPDKSLARARRMQIFHANIFFYANHFQFQIKRRLISILINL